MFDDCPAHAHYRRAIWTVLTPLLDRQIPVVFSIMLLVLGFYPAQAMLSFDGMDRAQQRSQRLDAAATDVLRLGHCLWLQR